MLIFVAFETAILSSKYGQYRNHAPKATESAASVEQEKPWDLRAASDPVAVFTFFLVVIAAGQVGLFWWQLGLIQEGADDAKMAAIAARDTAQATRESVDAAKDIAERQLRAYVMMDKGQFMNLEPGGKPRASISIKNYGSTPAYDLQSWTAMGVDFCPPVGGPRPNMQQFAIKTTVGPGASVTMDATVETILSGVDIAQMISRGKAVYMVAHIQYRDAFDHIRTTDLSLTSETRVGQEVPMVSTSGGNQAT